MREIRLTIVVVRDAFEQYQQRVRGAAQQLEAERKQRQEVERELAAAREELRTKRSLQEVMVMLAMSMSDMHRLTDSGAKRTAGEEARGIVTTTVPVRRQARRGKRCRRTPQSDDSEVIEVRARGD